MITAGFRASVTAWCAGGLQLRLACQSGILQSGLVLRFSEESPIREPESHDRCMLRVGLVADGKVVPCMEWSTGVAVRVVG